MPPNYEALRETPRALVPHQRLGVLVVGAAVILSGLGVGVWAATEGGPKGPCVTVVVAGSTGGEDLQHCRGDARKWCAAEAAKASRDAVASQARAACRRAGFLPR